VDWTKYEGADLHLIGGWPYALRPITDQAQPAYCNVLIAAYVTAGARVVMHQAIQGCVEHLVYTDTDSLWTTGELATGDGLGELRVTHEKRDLWVVAPKEYAIFSGEHLQEAHAKGVPDSLAYLYLTTGHAVFKSPVGLRESLSRDLTLATWIKRLRSRRHAWPKRPPDLAAGKQDDWWPTRPWDYQEIRDLVEERRLPPPQGAWSPAPELPPTP
jgi:hypothetical protein